MNQTKISVIMPSLNVSKYIKQCLQSVLNQTLEDIEIICVDGGSTDGILFSNTLRRITELNLYIQILRAMVTR